MRLRWKSDAAISAPVGPAETTAPQSPAATAFAARTIDASGLARTARAGSSSLVIATGASTTSPAAPSSDAGPKIRTGTPALRPPSATVAAPRSAPFASSAITEALLVEVRGGLRHYLAALVVAAGAAYAVGQRRSMALRAGLEPGRGDLVLRAPLVRA